MELTTPRLMVGCALLGVLVVAGMCPRRAELSNDAVQYLSSAENLRAGRGYSTSILYFDEQYQSGKLPAPQTVWPPGYPWLTAALATVGVPLEAAARLIPRLAYLIVIPAVYVLALHLTGDRAWAVLATLWQAGMTELWMFLASVNSEVPFIAAVLVAFAAAPVDEDQDWRWFPASLLLGIATTIRYAGLFLLAGVGLWLVGEVVRRWRMTGRMPVKLIGLASPGFLVAALLLLRNFLVSGYWQGGNTKPVHQAVGGLLWTSAISIIDLLAGVAPDNLHRGLPALAAMALGLTILALMAIRAVRASAVEAGESRQPGAEGRHRLAVLLGVGVLAYLSLLVWTSTRTMLTFGTRYVMPVAPLVICLIVYALSRPRGLRREWASAAIAGLLLSQLASVGRRWEAREALRPPDQAAADWVSQHTATAEPILVIGDGQRLGYAAHRPTAAVPHEAFTGVAWDEQRVRTVMRQYGIRTVVASHDLGSGRYTPFLQAIGRGQPPSWLTPVAELPSALVYQMRPGESP